MYGNLDNVKEVLVVDLRNPFFAHAAFSPCAIITVIIIIIIIMDVQSFCNCQHSLWWAG